MKTLCMIVAVGCFLWHFIALDPTRKDGPHGWIPLIGFFAAIGWLAGL